MKMNVIKNETNELIVEFETTDTTIPDLIAAQLLENDDVELAGVAKDQPEVGKPRLVLKTSKKKASTLFAKTLDELDDSIGALKSSLGKK